MDHAGEAGELRVVADSPQQARYCVLKRRIALVVRYAYEPIGRSRIRSWSLYENGKA